MWLSMHNKLLTNGERARCHLSSTTICELYSSGLEIIFHALPDCVSTKAVWNSLLPTVEDVVLSDHDKLKGLVG